MPLPYSEKVLEHFRRPRNVGRIENADVVATEGSPACGDMITIYMKVDAKTLRITDIKFESYGCASNIATASMVTEMAKGKTLEEAKKLSWKDVVEELGGLPPVKYHCSVMAIDALHWAVEKYEEVHGLARKEPTTKELVMKRLSHVIYPLTGVDIIRAKLLKSVNLKDGVITVELALKRDEPFSDFLENEIRERLKHRWDIKEVRVAFVDESERE